MRDERMDAIAAATGFTLLIGCIALAPLLAIAAVMAVSNVALAIAGLPHLSYWQAAIASVVAWAMLALVVLAGGRR